jgi:hypothetical protein
LWVRAVRAGVAVRAGQGASPGAGGAGAAAEGARVLIGDDKVRETTEKLLATCSEHDGELAEIDEVFVMVAVSYGPVDDTGEREATDFLYRCTSARPHVQLGMVEQARRAIEHTLERENREGGE